VSLEAANEVALTLPDGTAILKNGRAVKPEDERPANIVTVAREISSGREAARTLEKMHRKLGDLPDAPQKMNPIAAIITYKAIGLDHADIAVALGATTEQIDTIVESEAYKQIEQMFDQTVFEEERRNAKHIIAKASTKAAQTMVSMVDSSDENIALVASRDVLRLTGINTDEENNKRAGALRIVVTRKGDRDGELKVELNQ
jgi:hypothetical protein